MNKLWKILLTIGGIIGGMLLISSKTKSTYKKDLKDNKLEVKKTKTKIKELEKSKVKTKAKIKKTSKNISLVKAKIKPTTTTKKTTSNIKKKYRK